MTLSEVAQRGNWFTGMAVRDGRRLVEFHRMTGQIKSIRDLLHKLGLVASKLFFESKGGEIEEIKDASSGVTIANPYVVGEGFPLMELNSMELLRDEIIGRTRAMVADDLAEIFLSNRQCDVEAQIGKLIALCDRALREHHTQERKRKREWRAAHPKE